MAVDAAYFLPEALILGVPEIDAQHRDLFAKLAELKAVCIAENAFPAERAEELMVALVEHFATEERLAKAAGCDFSAHISKHEKMVLAIRKGIAKVNAGNPDIFGMLRYVEYWFERHIAEEDKVLGGILANGTPH